MSTPEAPADLQIPAGSAPLPAPAPFDLTGDPTQVPDYKQDTDWVQAILGQMRLIRGLRGKLRAVGVIVLRLLP